MAKSYYLPNDERGKGAWLSNLAQKLPTYQAALGLTNTDVTKVQADAAFFSYLLSLQDATATYGQQLTAYKQAAMSGNDASLGAAPVAPALTAPAAVAPGIFNRVKALVARIKAAPGYTQSIGEALGIVGAEQSPAAADLKPVLTPKLKSGQVVVGWKKHGMDGIEIHVDRGDGKGFVFLTIDTIPDYTDTAALPAAGQGVLWQYKAIYRQSDARVGQWSDVASLPVAGA